MNEPELGKEVVRLLDHGLDDIEQSTLNRLQAARRASLENYRVSESAINGGGGAIMHGWNGLHFDVRKRLSLFALLFALVGVVYWQTLQHGDETAAIDAMMLSDELPINAYLDDEFDLWLDPS